MGIQYTGGGRSTWTHKHGGKPLNYDLRTAIDLRKVLDIQKTVNNTEFVLKLRSDLSIGFMQAVK